jgi:hypothetical protein
LPENPAAPTRSTGEIIAEHTMNTDKNYQAKK